MNSLFLPPREPRSHSVSAWLLALGLPLCASLVLLLPFYWRGNASGHDFEFHVASWLDVAYQWKRGILFPHWTAWTNYGFGEPRYIFYPPLSWLLGASLCSLLPGEWVPATFILLTQTLAGLSAFILLRRLVPGTAALFAAVFYSANPYALLNSYVRSDFAEQLAMAILPLLLLGTLSLARIIDNNRSDIANIPGFAVPFAAIWLCNAPAGVIASYSVSLLFVWTFYIHRSLKLGLHCLLGLVLGFGLAGFYLVPAAYEQRWVNIGQALSSGLVPSENFLFTLGTDVEHAWFNFIASFCALLLILLMLLAALASKRFSGRFETVHSKAWNGLLLLGAAATLLMFRFTEPIWPYLPKLRFIQFPWRWMSIIALLACCFLAAAMAQKRPLVWFLFVLTLSVPFGYFLAQNTWWDPEDMPAQQAAIKNGLGFEGTDEYDPVGDDHLDLPKHAPLAAFQANGAADDADEQTAGKGTLTIEHWSTKRLAVHVESPIATGIALRLLNYPAWRVEVNEKVVVPDHVEGTAQMVVPVPEGKSEVRVEFQRTRDRTAGIAFSLISLAVVLWLLVANRHRAS